MTIYVYKAKNNKIQDYKDLEFPNNTPVKEIVSTLQRLGFDFTIYDVKECLTNLDLSGVDHIGEFVKRNGSTILGLQIS